MRKAICPQPRKRICFTENKNIPDPSKNKGFGIYRPVTFIPAYEPKTSIFSLFPGTALKTAKYQKNKCINSGIFLNISM